jgi:hypothetical protein
MADPKEPKKETVRITLPPRPAGQPATPGTSGRETVRINLPARPPGGEAAPRPPGVPGSAPARPPSAQPPLPPAPSKAVPPPPAFRKPPAPPGTATTPLMPSPSAIAPLAAAAEPNPPASSGPKKETARISVLPDPPVRPSPSVEMKKTQPLVTMPEAIPHAAPIAVNVAPTSVEAFVAEIPMPLCWGLLVMSAAILTIQIWNYVS